MNDEQVWSVLKSNYEAALARLRDADIVPIMTAASGSRIAGWSTPVGVTQKSATDDTARGQAQSWLAVWGALSGLDRCRPGETAEHGAVRLIGYLRAELSMWRKWRPFIVAFARWCFDGRYGGNPPTSGERWAAVRQAWMGEVNVPAEAGQSEGGEDTPARPEAPSGHDGCPLPAVGEWKWRWVDGKGGPYLQSNHVTVRFDGGLWYYYVSSDSDIVGDDGRVAFGIRCTQRGAKRAAEIAARRAWRVRNGAKP
jgi:hypothetical protein